MKERGDWRIVHGQPLRDLWWWLQGYVITYKAAEDITSIVRHKICGGKDGIFRPMVVPLFGESTKLPAEDLPSTVMCVTHERGYSATICAAMGTDRCRKWGGVGGIKSNKATFDELRETGKSKLVRLLKR